MKTMKMTRLAPNHPHAPQLERPTPRRAEGHRRGISLAQTGLALLLFCLLPSPVLSAGVAPKITVQPQSQTVPPGGTISLTVSATGTAPMTYFWIKDRTTIAGATSSTLTIANARGSDSATYRAVARNT